MKTCALMIAASMALAGPAAARDAEAELRMAIEAAGGLTTLTVLCATYQLDPSLTANLALLEDKARARPDYWKLFDVGVKTMTAVALAHPDTFCRDATRTLPVY